MDISKNIKALREAKKISQSEIARMLGIEPTNYPRIEKRGNKLTLEQLEKISNILGVQLIEFLGEETTTTNRSETDKKINILEQEIRELNRKIIDLELAKFQQTSVIEICLFEFLMFIATQYYDDMMPIEKYSNEFYTQLKDHKFKSLFDIIPESDLRTLLFRFYSNNYLLASLIIDDFYITDKGVIEDFNRWFYNQFPKKIKRDYRNDEEKNSTTLS